MFAFPPQGWTVRRRAGGALLVGPGGPASGMIRYTERAGPLRPAVAIVDAAGAPAGFVREAIEPPERLVTDEGEHAALVTVRGRCDGAPMQLCFGIVFLDDSCAMAQGVAPTTSDPAPIRAAVRAVIVGDVHLRGRPRRRRVVYQPPAGWVGRAAGVDAWYYPADHPANPARVWIGAAVPSAPGLIARTAEHLGAELPPVTAPLSTRNGLRGQRIRLRGAAVESYLFALDDGTYAYLVRADVRAGGPELALIEALVESIEPVPGPRVVASKAAEALAVWSD
ncbi:MAG: hypothetical protein H6709_02695 [Kofleriaceae bacterium]|nr:hypothetical protein [Myxococcales bacterium]MCB9565484.1 hypothetical protein [Kofleriaceae bacterium]MCB9570975.1 hypothetical protein [Kofleriaceae bacterium]